jgi:hypothetical protein
LLLDLLLTLRQMFVVLSQHLSHVLSDLFRQLPGRDCSRVRFDQPQRKAGQMLAHVETDTDGSGRPIGRKACSNTANACPLVTWAVVNRRTRHPRITAAFNFSQSRSYPAPRVCRPLTHVPPSTSTASSSAGHAKSKRHRRTG